VKVRANHSVVWQLGRVDVVEEEFQFFCVLFVEVGQGSKIYIAKTTD